jgi:hypothetical protein
LICVSWSGWLYQDHLDLRAVREQRRDDVVDGSRRVRVEAGQVRPLQTIFGAVEVTAPGVSPAREAQPVSRRRGLEPAP